VPLLRIARIVAALAASVCSRRLRPNFVPSLSRAPSRPDALADHRVLELGEHAHHLEHGAPRRCGRVEALLVEEQVNVLGVKLLQERQKVHQ
jgi:hypothetical protein